MMKWHKGTSLTPREAQVGYGPYRHQHNHRTRVIKAPGSNCPVCEAHHRAEKKRGVDDNAR
jgi:hypothetical protein